MVVIDDGLGELAFDQGRKAEPFFGLQAQALAHREGMGRIESVHVREFVAQADIDQGLDPWGFGSRRNLGRGCRGSGMDDYGARGEGEKGGKGMIFHRKAGGRRAAGLPRWWSCRARRVRNPHCGDEVRSSFPQMRLIHAK